MINPDFGIKQFVPEEVCLKCQGCCRFREAVSVWLPRLLDKEVLALKKSNISYSQDTKIAFSDNFLPTPLTKKRFSVVSRHIYTFLYHKKIIPVFSKKENIFFCPLLNREENKCVIYGERFFDCRLYPFVINRKEEKFYLAADFNCGFVKNNFRTVDFDRYFEYLLGLLNSQIYKDILKNNPQIIQLYPGVVDLAELAI